MRKRLASPADDFTVTILDDKGRLALSMRFESKQLRDAAIDALQKMLDRAEAVDRL